MLLAQTSDLHVKAERWLAYGVVDTAAMLERCVAAILDLSRRPDAVIVADDLVDLGRPGECGLLRKMLSPLASAPRCLLFAERAERMSIQAVNLHAETAPRRRHVPCRSPAP